VAEQPEVEDPKRQGVLVAPAELGARGVEGGRGAAEQVGGGGQFAPPDVTITGTAQALTALIFAGSDRDIDIAGESGPVQRFRQLISTMAAVVHP
jgi:hypothetical protein